MNLKVIFWTKKITTFYNKRNSNQIKFSHNNLKVRWLFIDKITSISTCIKTEAKIFSVIYGGFEESANYKDLLQFTVKYCW